MNRAEEALQRAIAHGLPDPPPMDPDADPAEVERHTVMRWAWEIARRQHEWADRVLAVGGDDELAEC